MSEEKKPFQRQQNRFLRTASRPSANQSIQVKNSLNQSQIREKSLGENDILSQSDYSLNEQSPYNYTSVGQVALRKVIGVSREEFPNLLKDKLARQELKKQERRLIKIRTDNKLKIQTDNELSILALNNILALSEEVIADFVKQKQTKVVENKVRANQEKEMARQLNVIDQQIQLGNFTTVKVSIQGLMKKFGKDQYLQAKIGYLNYIQILTEDYEKEAGMLKELSNYVQKLSVTDNSPESVNQSVVTLKSLKKDLTLSANKQNKKSQPNQRLLSLISQIDKIDSILLSLIEPKIEKKGPIDLKSKREQQLQKELAERIKAGQGLDEAARWCRQVLEKTSENKDDFGKQIEAIRRNKKKANEVPYSIILKIYDSTLTQKKQANQINIFLKAIGQLYQRKNLSGQILIAELKKCEQKYANNQLLANIKPNLDNVFANVQQKERSNSNSTALDLEIKKLKKQNQRLQKVVEDAKSKMVEKVIVDVLQTDKKRQIEEKRTKQAERIKLEKEEKDLEKSFDNIFTNLVDKKWKPARNAINVFIKRYEESANPVIPRSLQSMNAILSLLQQTQNLQGLVSEAQKKQKWVSNANDKQKQAIINSYKPIEEFQGLIKQLLINFSQDKYQLKKYFQDLRKDRKKIVQERYILLSKLQQPLMSWRSKKGENLQSNETKNISLNLSSISMENEIEKNKKQRDQFNQLLETQKQKVSNLEQKLKSLQVKNQQDSKDAKQLLTLVGKIQKGGQWWKFLPTNLKNSTFKSIYTLLQKNRQNELEIQKYQVNESLFKEEGKTINNALELIISLIDNGDVWYSDDFWEKKLAAYRGQVSCDKLINCLRLLNAKANRKLAEQRKGYQKSAGSYETEIQKLTTAISEIEKGIGSQRARDSSASSSKMQQSGSKKSIDLKSSRKSSKSREKDSKIKQAMQEYIQEERNLLSKIEVLEEDRQNFEMKARAIQNQLIQSQKKLEQGRLQFQNLRFSMQKVRMQQIQRINELQGELQISEGRRAETQNRVESQLSYYRQMHDQFTQKLQQSKQKEIVLVQQSESYRLQYNELMFKYENDIMILQQEMKKEIILLKQELQNYKVTMQTNTDLVPVHSIQTTVVHTQSNGQLEGVIGKLNQEIIGLKNYINLKQEEKGAEIQREVIGALKNQQIQFNQYLAKVEKERYQSFMTDILPAKVQQEITNRGLHNFTHNEWIQTQFPRLYEERHSRQCAQANQTVETTSLAKVIQFQNVELPLIIKEQRQIWEKEQEIEWESRVKEIQGYWLNVFLPEREKEWTIKYQQLAVNAKIQPIYVQKIVEREVPHQIYVQKIVEVPREVIVQRIVEVPKEIYIQKIIEVPRDVIIQKIVEVPKQIYIQKIVQVPKEIIVQKIIEVPRQIYIQKHAEGPKQVIIQKIVQVPREIYVQKIVEVPKEIIIQKIVEVPRDVVVERIVEKIVPHQVVVEKIVEREVIRQMSELQLLAKMRDTSNNWILDTLIDDRRIQWEHQKQLDLNQRTRQVEEYWMTVIIPEKKLEWQAETNTNNKIITVSSPIAQVNKEEIIQEWKLKNLTNIIDQWKLNNLPLLIEQWKKEHTPLIIQEWTATQLPAILQEWKVANLPAIIDIERHAAIQDFVNIQLPLILDQEYRNWLASTEPVVVGQVEMVQPNVDDLLRVERQKWQLYRLQQVKRIQMEFANRINQLQRNMQAQIIQEQEKLLQEKQRSIEIEVNAVNQWKLTQLPQLIAKERDNYISQFKQKQLYAIIQKAQLDWEANNLLQIINKVQNRWILDTLIAERKGIWEEEKAKEKIYYDQALQRERDGYQQKINELKLQWERQREIQSKEWTFSRLTDVEEIRRLKLLLQSNSADSSKISQERSEWEKQKQLQWNLRVQQVQNYWQNVVIPERIQEWKNHQDETIDQLLTLKLKDQEKQYRQNIIPAIINDERSIWNSQIDKQIEIQRQSWLNSLPQLMKSSPICQKIVQSYLQNQASEYQIKIKKIQAQTSTYDLKNKQLQTQVSDFESKVKQLRNKYQIAEKQLNNLLLDNQSNAKKTFQENNRLNEELGKTKWVQKEVDQLKRVVDKQKQEIRNNTILLKENDRLKQENLGLRESASNIQNSKWREINDIKMTLESKILQLSNERNLLMTRVSDIEGAKKEGVDKEAYYSLERQVSTLNSTLKTKDAEIAFTKKTMQNLNNQIREHRDRINGEIEKRSSSERLLAEMKNSKLQQEYENKYLKQRQESLLKRVEMKDQELNNMRKKYEAEQQTLQKKVKNHLQSISSYHIRYNELQSLFNIKTKEHQSVGSQVDRLRYQNQKLQANNRLLSSQNDNLKRLLRQIQSKVTQAQFQIQKDTEVINKMKFDVIQGEQRQGKLKIQLEEKGLLFAQIQKEKRSLESDVFKLRDQVSKLWNDLEESQRLLRRESDRAMRLEKQIHEVRENVTKEADPDEIQMLNKINKDVTELTTTNRQLQLKAALLQNKERITQFDSQVINYFLLIQKNTDSLINSLLKDGVIADLQIYNQFLSNSKNTLTNGQLANYFQQWQQMLRGLFHVSIATQSEQIRVQAQELIRLRDEMNEVLDRQIEMSDGDCNQLMEDYKIVLGDIKSLVKEYVRSGDQQYLGLLCSSLGITEGR